MQDPEMRWRRYICRACAYQWELPGRFEPPERCPSCGRTDKLSESASVTVSDDRH